MIEAAREAMAFASSRTESDLLSDRMLARSLDVNLRFVWNTVAEDLPVLVEALERVLASSVERND